METDFIKRLREDEEFKQRLMDTSEYEARMAMIREEGYQMKSVSDYIERTKTDVDFVKKLNEHDSFEKKAEFILLEGYYFTQQDLMHEHERLAKIAGDELTVVEGGSYENDLNYSCCQSTCPSHFKCTWG